MKLHCPMQYSHTDLNQRQESLVKQKQILNKSCRYVQGMFLVA